MLRNDRDGRAPHHRRTSGPSRASPASASSTRRDGSAPPPRPAEVGPLVDIGRGAVLRLPPEATVRSTAWSGADRVRIFRGSDGQRVLGIIAPIHNEPQCATACHAHPRQPERPGGARRAALHGRRWTRPSAARSARCRWASLRPSPPCCSWPGSWSGAWCWRPVRPPDRGHGPRGRRRPRDARARSPRRTRSARWPRPGTR